MVIKRIPLFIFGLLYGAVINSVVLGLGYGVYAAVVAMQEISKACCQGSDQFRNSDEACGAFLLVGFIALVGAVIGFAVGVFYGLFTGS